MEDDIRSQWIDRAVGVVVIGGFAWFLQNLWEIQHETVKDLSALHQRMEDHEQYNGHRNMVGKLVELEVDVAELKNAVENLKEGQREIKELILAPPQRKPEIPNSWRNG